MGLAAMLAALRTAEAVPGDPAASPDALPRDERGPSA